MISRFGKVMIYVNDPRAAADFWVGKIGFIEVGAEQYEGGTLSVELTPDLRSDASIVLFDRGVVEKMSPELHLGTPSILFMSPDAREMRETLMRRGVTVGETAERGGSITFNFSDPEGSYFAVQEIKK